MSFNPNATGTPQMAKASGSTGQPNATGSTLYKGAPVKLNGSGLGTVNVSVEADVDAFSGILAGDTPDGQTGSVINAGLLEDISTTFSVGDPVFVAKNGTLTNQKPSIGSNSFVLGDFVIFIGVILKNVSDPLKKDLLVNLQVRGVL